MNKKDFLNKLQAKPLFMYFILILALIILFCFFKKTDFYTNWTFPKIPARFEGLQNPYNNMETLKMSFYKEYSKYENFLNTLKGKNPKDKRIKEIKRYLHSMRNASFPCPEHKGKPKCKECNRGVVLIIFKPEECPRCLGIYDGVKCPYCNKREKGEIKGAWILTHP